MREAEKTCGIIRLQLLFPTDSISHSPKLPPTCTCMSPKLYKNTQSCLLEPEIDFLKFTRKNMNMYTICKESDENDDTSVLTRLSS